MEGTGCSFAIKWIQARYLNFQEHYTLSSAPELPPEDTTRRTPGQVKTLEHQQPRRREMRSPYTGPGDQLSSLSCWGRGITCSKDWRKLRVLLFWPEIGASVTCHFWKCWSNVAETLRSLLSEGGQGLGRIRCWSMASWLFCLFFNCFLIMSFSTLTSCITLSIKSPWTLIIMSVKFCP